MDSPARPDLLAIARDSGLPWLEAAVDLRIADDYFGYAIAAAFLLKSLPSCESILAWARTLSDRERREIEGAAIASLDRLEEEIRYVLSYRSTSLAWSGCSRRAANVSTCSGLSNGRVGRGLGWMPRARGPRAFATLCSQLSSTQPGVVGSEM